MSLEMQHIENIAETEPELRYIKVYRVRHGKSVYKEHVLGKNVLPEEELDLTAEEGVGQIKQAAEVIKSRIDKARDLVVLMSSPRRRAESAVKIITSVLKEAFPDEGIIQDLDTENSKYQRRLKAIESVNLVDEEGNRVGTDDPRYPQLFATEAAKLIEESSNEGMSTTGYLATYPDKQFGQFERTEDLRRRTRTHLARLIHIARLKQPELAKKGKRLVIIEVEHNETLDEIYEKASGGAYTYLLKTEDKKGTGPVEGEVVELLIPSDKGSNEMRVNFLGEGRDKDEKKIVFDPRTEEFQ